MNKKSFTLIELLVVIAIIGILSSLVIARFSDWGDNARIANTLQWSAGVHRILGANLVGHWPLNGDVNDISGHNNHGEIVGSPEWVSGIPGSNNLALEFNGSDEYVGGIEETDRLDPSSITVSSWINMSTTASTSRHIWLTKWYGYSCEIQADTRIPYFRLDGPGDTVSSEPLILGKWYQFVGTYDSTIGGRVYLNGELVGSRGPSGEITHTWSFPLNIGRWSGGVYFKGKISDVRIYNTVLAAEEVGRIYAESKDRYLAYE